MSVIIQFEILPITGQQKTMHRVGVWHRLRISINDWVTMGTVYGFHEGAHSKEVQQHTDRLLTGLTTRVVDGAHGLRMVSGD